MILVMIFWLVINKFSYQSIRVIRSMLKEMSKMFPLFLVGSLVILLDMVQYYKPNILESKYLQYRQNLIFYEILYYAGCLACKNVRIFKLYCICLLYTSDAADERSSVDLGGRRIIKKKKK